MQKLKKGSKGKQVKLLKHYLNKLVVPVPNLKESDDKFDADTENAVIAYKTQKGMTPPDGVVDANTWGAMGEDLGYRLWQETSLTHVPEWMVSIATGTPMKDGPLDIDRAVFFRLYMQHYGPLSDSQAQGLALLLDFIDRDDAITDVRWAAYLLATVKWECANTWQPIEEYGKGAGKSYGNAVSVKGSDGKTYSNKYYGRGYVQLTWKGNYESMSKELGMGDELLIHPERVMEPEIAYKIISLGMTTGKSFANKHKFADYLNAGKTDYKNARRMVNGTDHNKEIADIAKSLEVILKSSINSCWEFLKQPETMKAGAGKP